MPAPPLAYLEADIREQIASPTPAPISSATTNPGTLDGAIPEKLSLNIRPKAAAGFAKDVEEVNQYAAPM